MFRLLEKEDEYREVAESSPILIIFKHSRTCATSIAARERLVAVDYMLPNMYEVVVQDSPELSQLITDELSLRHETPQVLVIQNGEVVYHRDHNDIRGDQLVDFVKNLQRQNR